jgi:hypothetical protein
MSGDQRERHRRLAKKAAKRKLHSAAKKISQKRGVNYEAVREMTGAAASPVYEALAPENLFEQGIGNVILSRRLPDGRIASGVFLVDVFCLGIKNCFFTVLPPLPYKENLERISSHGALETWHPSCVAKLIRDAETFARGLGFKPHADYTFTRKILADLDPALCPRTFTFGKDGKPFYISGPHETPNDIKRTMDTLARQKGPGEFDYLIMADEDAG